MYCKRLIYIASVLACIISSCVSKKEQELQELRKVTVNLPTAQLMNIHPANGLCKEKNSDLKFIVYVDTEKCSNCEIDKLGEWNSIYRKTNEITNVDFFFIISANPENKERIIDKYYTNKFLHDVYIDSIGCFKRNNPFIKNELFHTFLIDSNNHLLYVGNPNRNLKAENALMEILKSQQQQQLISSH